jgi:putative ABC transport system permease protein
VYNQVSGKDLVFSLVNIDVWWVLLAAITGTMVVASIYPALLLSSFKPIEALKGKLSLGAGNAGFRKILVVTQFVFSAGLIIATIIISLQLKYIREKDLGFNKEHVFSFPIREELFKHYDVVRSKLLKTPGVLAVSSSDANIIGVNSTTGDTDWEGKEASRTFLIHPNPVDEHFIPLFKMQFVAGKNFTGVKADSMHIILNETAVAEAGIKDPVGKRFTIWENKATIIGVVKDYNYASLKQRIEPAAFYYAPANWRIFIKTTGKDAHKAIETAQTIWTKYTGDYPFHYSFVDEDYNMMYKSEQRTGILFNVFAIVAITISCLGLFGLAAYTAQVKTKEIGIRKVLGATVANITGLLAKDFVRLVLKSLIIAIPAAWWAMNSWLQDFVYRINISWWIFLLAGTLAMLIAVLTVSFHAIKAALANPVKSLKEE